MSDINKKAHEIGLKLAALAAVDAKVRSDLKEQGADLDTHHAVMAVPARTLVEFAKIADSTLQLLSEVGLIDPLRIKVESHQEREKAERDMIARKAIMQGLAEAVKDVLGIKDGNVSMMEVSPEDLKKMVAGQPQAQQDDEDACDCPNCTIRRAVLSGEVDVEQLDLPPAIKHMMKDFTDSIKQDAAEEANPASANMMPADRRYIH